MLEQVKQQQNAYEKLYAPQQKTRFDFHITTNPLTRYMRDRCLIKSLQVLNLFLSLSSVLVGSLEEDPALFCLIEIY